MRVGGSCCACRGSGDQRCDVTPPLPQLPALAALAPESPPALSGAFYWTWAAAIGVGSAAVHQSPGESVDAKGGQIPRRPGGQDRDFLTGFGRAGRVPRCGGRPAGGSLFDG